MDIRTDLKTGKQHVKLLKVEQRRLAEAEQVLNTIARCTGNTQLEAAAFEIHKLLNPPGNAGNAGDAPDPEPAKRQQAEPNWPPTRVAAGDDL